MRTQQFKHKLKGGGFGSLLFFTMVISSFAQIGVLGDLWRERFVKAGEKYVEKLTVQNPTGITIAVHIFGMDIKESLGEINTVPLGSIKRSNASWMTLPKVRYEVKGGQKIDLEVPITVPKDTRPGTYYSAIVVMSEVLVQQEKKASGRVGVQVVIQVCSTVLGGKNAIEVARAKVEGDELLLDVRNTGDNVLILRFFSDDISGRMRIYPGETQRKKVDVSSLEDGFHKRRVIFDDEKAFLFPVEITFKKGAAAAPLVTGRGSRLSQLGSLSIAVDVGMRRNGVRLLGNLNLGRFRIGASGSYNEVDSFSGRGYQAYASWYSRHVSVNAGAYYFGDLISKNVGIGLRFGKVNLNVMHLIDFGVTNISSSMALGDRFSIAGYATVGKTKERNDASLSVMVRIF